MTQEKRKFRRFLVEFYVSKIGSLALSGKIKDFSRKGMRVIFDAPDIDEKNEIQIVIHRPDYNELVSVASLIAWKKCFEGKCEVGLEFKDFPVQAKADFLDYGYRKWLKGKSHQ